MKTYSLIIMACISLLSGCSSTSLPSGRAKLVSMSHEVDKSPSFVLDESEELVSYNGLDVKSSTTCQECNRQPISVIVEVYQEDKTVWDGGLKGSNILWDSSPYATKSSWNWLGIEQRMLYRGYQSYKVPYQIFTYELLRYECACSQKWYHHLFGSKQVYLLKKTVSKSPVKWQEFKAVWEKQ